MELDSIIGGLAAALTTVANLPQLAKCLRGSTHDLSLRMYVILATGVAIWALYGILRSDVVIMAANGATLALLLIILALKLREITASARDAPGDRG
jgi:MtN3 and saliva related transmembrane protein